MILALVTRTAYKGGVSIPVSTVKPTASWVNEGATSDKQKKDIKKDGMITFAYHKLRCAVAVSLEVDTMAISAFESLLINNIVEAMTKAVEQAIISGDGTGKPKGILAETPADGQTISSAKPSFDDLTKAEAALPLAYEGNAKWCMSKKTFMSYIGITDSNGQPIARVNTGIAGKPERTLLGREVVLCDYVTSYTSTLAADSVFAFLFNFTDYVLNTNYSMGVKKYEDNDTDDMVTKAIMLVDGKAVDVNSLVVIKKAASV
jgi:HK97 family phage major capsid protein